MHFPIIHDSSFVNPNDIIFQPSQFNSRIGYISPIKLKQYLNESVFIQANALSSCTELCKTDDISINIKGSNNFPLFKLFESIDKMIIDGSEKIFNVENIKDYVYDPIIKNENGINYVNIKFLFNFVTHKIDSSFFLNKNIMVTDIKSGIDVQTYINQHNNFDMILKINHVLFNKDTKTYKIMIKCVSMKFN